MKFHELQALWWMNSATNGHCNIRHITTGNGRRLNNDELRDNAMETSQRHMELFRECNEAPKYQGEE